MKETFLVLFTSHLLGDFALQPDSIAKRKAVLTTLLLHVGIVTFVSFLLLGSLNVAVLSAIFITHALADGVKARQGRESLPWFIGDQAFHCMVLASLAFLFPDAFENGLWNALLPAHAVPYYLALMTVAASVTLMVSVGGLVVGKLVKSFLDELRDDERKGLTNGGKVIGWLERLLVLLLMLADLAEGIGFLVAAKSILRFPEIKEGKDRRVSEYIIIGSLLSFTWAILVAAPSTQAVQHWFPNLENVVRPNSESVGSQEKAKSVEKPIASDGVESLGVLERTSTQSESSSTVIERRVFPSPNP
jgi:hypothetical protein